jgi:hypothetical protein
MSRVRLPAAWFVAAITATALSATASAQQASEDSASSATPIASASPAPEAEASASPAPDTTSAPTVRHARRRHHVHHRRVVRRRTRRVRRARPRGPTVIVTTRYTGIPTEGSPGPTWTVRFSGFPIAQRRDAGRFVRFSLGGELAFRGASQGRLDTIAWSVFDIGFQYPFRAIVPFVTGVADFGIAERMRFSQPMFEFAWQLGVEAGIDIRPPGWIVGLELAAGAGRTAIGNQWTLNGWARFGLAFF